ncbi:ABC transporter substrate-binding protein [Frankia sp. QA3]|uniref:ABC transporter substrate-binding protein n=1 Tax=Frankia sp. QA3 TaxID=710111 RepID=UPI000269BEC0|nr:ABC transporter substrate-binding protein [Frankia sp. QA3]EIV91901.1 ABC-type branched-chain amino acid transport system, periplasmic component [Frankia sp. QA3]
MPRMYSSLVLAIVLLALAGLAGGCSSGTQPAAAGCDTPGVTADQVRLGLLYPDSGPTASSLAAVRAGIDARLGLANDNGGIHGRKIVYDWRDDQGTTEANATAARDLIEGKQDFGILEYSLAADGSARYLAERDVPVAGLAASDSWSTNRNMFSFSYTTGSSTDTYGTFVKSRGGTRAVLLTTALSAGVSGAGGRFAASLRGVGIPVVDQIGYTANADSPAAIARRLAATGADTLVTVVGTPDLPAVLRELPAAGWTPKVILSASGYDSELLADAGGAMTGVVVPLFYRPFEAGGAPITGYVDAMTRHAPQIANPRQDLAMIGYIDTDLFLRGLQEAGACPTRRGFVDALRSVRSYDAGGLISPIDLSTNLGRPTTCLAFVQANAAGSFDVLDERLCGRELPASSATG